MCLSFEMRSFTMFTGDLLGLYGKMQNRGVSFGVSTCLLGVRKSARLSLFALERDLPNSKFG